jgi:hypothetical protein
MDLEDRFWAKVEKGDGCWAWAGGKVHGGYGVITVGARGAGHIRAHRFSYLLHKGPIPAGLMVLHTCDNPECTNPDHLMLGDAAENMRHVSDRKRNPLSRKTHCVNGHEFTPENTIIRGGQRRCRACKNEYEREKRRKERGSQFGIPSHVPKTHCPKGHEFTAENTYVNPKGYRECIQCRRDRMQEFLARRKATN